MIKTKVIAILIISLAALGCLTGCTSMSAKERRQGAFEYRDIYLPKYNEKENSKFDLNTIDKDWAIWGHNLGQMMPDYAKKQIYAKVNGVINAEQFCFSSEKLYDYIVEYIEHQYPFVGGKRFAILPNDNEIVCLCSACRRLGNEPGNASPAVLHLIEKLAEQFPQHEFYTSHYNTTNHLPDKQMAPNTGVLVSAIHYPLSAAETTKEMEFLTLLNRWSEKASKIYVWDYIQNYDDYFTPFPVLTVAQRRLKLYRDAGVSGVFLNGSGSDYSTFYQLNKAVLSQLLIDPDQDWEELLRQYADEYFPTAGKDIADFMIRQEKMVQDNGKVLPFYDGVSTALKRYLPEKEFIDFYGRLLGHLEDATGDERHQLERLTGAMALTMLEIKRINDDLSDTEPLKARLENLMNDENPITYYNEGCWSIQRYLDNYTAMENDARSTEQTNLLHGITLNRRTALDEDYEDIDILTDGLLGIPSNYHNGLLITSADPSFSIGIPRVPGMKKLRVWMVQNSGFKIGLPTEVYLTVGGMKLGRQEPPKPTAGPGHSYVDFDIPPSGEIILTLVKDPEVKTMALEEVQAF